MSGRFVSRALTLGRASAWVHTGRGRAQQRRFRTSASASGGGLGSHLSSKWLLVPAAAAALAGGFAYAHNAGAQVTPATAEALQKYGGPHEPATRWEAEIASQPGTLKVGALMCCIVWVRE